MQVKLWSLCWGSRKMIGRNQGWWCTWKQGKLDTSQFLVRCSCSPSSPFVTAYVSAVHVHASHCKFRARCWGPGRALLYNFWLHYVKTVIELMKQMEGMREERCCLWWKSAVLEYCLSKYQNVVFLFDCFTCFKIIHIFQMCATSMGWNIAIVWIDRTVFFKWF